MELSARSTAQHEIPKDLDFSFKTTGKKTVKGGDNKEYVRFAGSAKLGGQTYMVSILVSKDQLKNLKATGGLETKLALTALKTCEAFVLAEAKFGGGFTEVGLSKNQVTLKGSDLGQQSLKDLASMSKAEIGQSRNAVLVQNCVNHLMEEFKKPAVTPATADGIKFKPDAPIRKPSEIANQLLEKTKEFEKEVNTALHPPGDSSKTNEQNDAAGKEALAKFPEKANQFKAELAALKQEAKANVKDNPDGTKFKEIIEARITQLEIIAAHCDQILSPDNQGNVSKQIAVLTEVQEQITEMAKPESTESLKLAANAALPKTALPTPLTAPKANDYVKNLKEKTDKFQEQLIKFESSPKGAEAKSALAGAAQEFKKELQTIHTNVSTHIQEGLDPAGKKFKTTASERMHELAEVADTCINNTKNNKKIDSKKMLTKMKKLSDVSSLDSLATNAKVASGKPMRPMDKAQLALLQAEITPLFAQYNEIQEKGRLTNPNQLANFGGLEKLHDKLAGFRNEQGKIKAMMAQVKMWELEMAKNGGIDKPFLSADQRKLASARTPLNSTKFMEGLQNTASTRLPPVPTRPAPPIPTSSTTLPGGVVGTNQAGPGTKTKPPLETVKTTDSKLKESGVDIEVFMDAFSFLQGETTFGDVQNKVLVQEKLSKKNIESKGKLVSLEDQFNTLESIIPNNPMVKEIKRVLGEWKNQDFSSVLELTKNQFIQSQTNVVSTPNEEALSDIGNLFDDNKAVLDGELKKIDPALASRVADVLSTNVENMSEDQKDVQFKKVTDVFDELPDLDIPNVFIALTEKAVALSTESKNESSSPTPQAATEFKQINAELDSIMDGFEAKLPTMLPQQKIDTQFKLLNIQAKLLDHKFDNVMNDDMKFEEVRPSMMDLLNGVYDKLSADEASNSAVSSSNPQTNNPIENRSPLQPFDLQTLDPKDFKKLDEQIQHLTYQFSEFARSGLKPTSEDKEKVAEFKTSLTNLHKAIGNGRAILTILDHANKFESTLANNEDIPPNEKLSLSSLPTMVQSEYNKKFETVMKERGIKTDYAIRKEQANSSRKAAANPLNSTIRGQHTPTEQIVNTPPTEKVSLLSLSNQVNAVESKMEILKSFKNAELKNAFNTIFSNLMKRANTPRENELRALSPEDMKTMVTLSKDFKELENALDNLAQQAKSNKSSSKKAKTPLKAQSGPETQINSQTQTNRVADTSLKPQRTRVTASVEDFKNAGVDINEFTTLFNEISSEITTEGKTEGHQYMLTGNLSDKTGAPAKNLMEQLSIIKQIIPNNPTIQVMEESMNAWLQNESADMEIDIKNLIGEASTTIPTSPSNQTWTNGTVNADSNRQMSRESVSVEDFQNAGVDIKEFTDLFNEISSEITNEGKTEGHQYMLTGNLVNKKNGEPEKNLMEQLSIIKHMIPNNPTVQIMEEAMNAWQDNKSADVQIDLASLTGEDGWEQVEAKVETGDKGNAMHRRNAKDIETKVHNDLKGGALRRNEAKEMGSKIEEDFKNNFTQLKNRIGELTTQYNALIQNKNGKNLDQPTAYVGGAQRQELMQLSEELKVMKDNPVLKNSPNFTKFNEKVQQQLSALKNGRDAIGITDVKSNLIMDEMDAAIKRPGIVDQKS